MSLLPSEDLAKKLARSNVTTMDFRLLPEYKAFTWIRVTVYSVLMQFNGDVIAAYMSAYDNVKEVTIVRSADGTARCDFVLNICLSKESFHIFTYHGQKMIVAVNSRRLLC